MGCFSGPKIPTPPAPPEFKIPPFPAIVFPAMPDFPAPFDPTAGAAKQARAAEIAALKLIERKRRGYASTLLTGGRGLDDEPETERRPARCV